MLIPWRVRQLKGSRSSTTDGRAGPLIASALIMIVTVAGWLVMPRIMLAVSGGGPFAGVAVALLFILAFFAVLWLRARHQRRINGG